MMNCVAQQQHHHEVDGWKLEELRSEELAKLVYIANWSFMDSNCMLLHVVLEQMFHKATMPSQ